MFRTIYNMILNYIFKDVVKRLPPKASTFLEEIFTYGNLWKPDLTILKFILVYSNCYLIVPNLVFYLISQPKQVINEHDNPMVSPAKILYFIWSVGKIFWIYP